MNLQTKLIHEIINEDFGCTQCVMNDKCPVYNGTDSPRAKRAELRCIAYTYKHVAERIFNRLAEMPWNEGLDTIQVAERVFVKLAAMPLAEVISTIADEEVGEHNNTPNE